MYKVLFIFIIATLGISVSSCSSEDGQTPAVAGEQPKANDNSNVEPMDSVKVIEQQIWYAGEAPTDLEKLQLLSIFNSGEKKFDFYAVFTEPFWSFYFFGNQVLFNAADFEVPEVLTLEYPFSDKEDEQSLSFMRNGEFWQLNVIKEAGSDGMSDLEYPYSVKLDLMEGGGGTSFVREK
jgi:uncharacterized membrane protein